MLRIARANAPANVTWREGTAAGIGPALGRFRLVTMGRSFHWMDRVDTLARLDALIVPQGAIALFSDSHPELPENSWLSEFRGVVERYAGDDETRHRGELVESVTTSAAIARRGSAPA